MAWQRVPLGEVISPSIDAVDINPTISYQMSGVYSFGRGLFSRGLLSGSETTYKRFHRLDKGMIVLSQLKAWEGAIAIVSEAHTGHFLSTQFPTFRCDAALADTNFIGWYLRQATVWEMLRSKARGMGARRDTVSPTSFMELEIPLPPLDEQCDIVQRLDAVQAKIDEAISLYGSISSENTALLYALLNGPNDAPHQRVRFGDISQQMKHDISVKPDTKYQFAGVYSFGRGVFQSQVKLGSEFSYEHLSKIYAGDFIYPKLMAWEGALGVVPDSCDGLYVSPEFPVFSLDNEIIYPEVVDAYFRHPSTWPNLDTSSKGTNLRRRRLNPKVLKEHLLPVPPRAVQDTIREMSTYKAEQIRQKNVLELEGLIPAMLHEIFEKQNGTEKLSAGVVIPFEKKQQMPHKGHDNFREAVLVGAIVKAFTADGQPIGNFRLQKAVYFARRHMGEGALADYVRKAAGPYNPNMRYAGGIKIATDKGWIKRGKKGKLTGSVLGNAAADMDEWIEKYDFGPAAAWVHDGFFYKRNDLWETLATIDYSVLALEVEGVTPTPAAILAYIESEPEWLPKVTKLHLTEPLIQNNIVELQCLFPDRH